MPSTTPLPIACYLRISDDPLNLLAGVTRQRQDTHATAADRWPGHPPVDYVDNDASAYSGKPRPAYLRMVADIAAGKLHGAVAWDQDRLLRLPIELEELIKVCDRAQFANLATASGEIDLTSHDGQFKARIMAAVAKKSSDDTSRRVRRAHRDRVERGLWSGSPPYGYNRGPHSTLTLDLAAAATIRQALTLIGRGTSLRALVRTFPPPAPRTGPGWVKVLTNPALAGLNRGGYSGTWEPIITRTVHADLLAMFADPARRTSTKTSHRTHWLTGVLICGNGPADDLCAARLMFQPNPRARPDELSRRGYYICPACSKVSVSATLAEQIVRVWLFDAAPAREPAARDDRGEASRAAAEARLADLAAMYAAGEIERAEWIAARSAARVEPPPRESSRSALIDLPSQLSLAWAGLSVSHRHAIARHYLLAVVVRPGTRGSFDESRLYPKWRP